MRAMVMDSEMMDRTRGLLFRISADSTRANFTAAIRPATTAKAPADLSAAAAESGARKQSFVRYCRVSSQCWHLMTGLCSMGSILWRAWAAERDLPAGSADNVPVFVGRRVVRFHSGKRSRAAFTRRFGSALKSPCVWCCYWRLGCCSAGFTMRRPSIPDLTRRTSRAVFLNLRAQGYDESRATVFFERLRERISALPGVIEVAQAECAPLSHDFSDDHFTVPGRPAKFAVEYNHISPGYFSVVGIPIVRGRGFTAESHDAPGVIVTESTARRLWPGKDPLTKTLREDSGRDYSVIGVAKMLKFHTSVN